MRIKLFEIASREIKKFVGYGRRVNFYTNDIDNLYPNRIYRLISLSPTANRARNLMAKFITCKGLNEDFVVNRFKETKASELSQLLARQLATYGGFFVHISFKYDADSSSIIPSSSAVIDFKKGRIEKADSDNYMGKLKVCDWEKYGSSFADTSKEVKTYYPFSLNQDKIQEQLKDAWEKKQRLTIKEKFTLEKAIKIFPGQYYYYNRTPEEIYPEAYIHSVELDTDSERRVSMYNNTQLREGFLGKTVVVTNGIDKEEEGAFEDTVKTFLGSENSSSVLHYPLSRVNGEDLDKALKFIQLKPQFDDKLFSETKKTLRTNILSAFNNIPESLIITPDRALFSQNAQAYKEYKQMYQEQNEEERKAILSFFKEVYNKDLEFKLFENDKIS